MAGYYKGSGGGVNTTSHTGNSANNTGGNPGHSLPQKPVPGPASTGGPASLKKALADKPDTSRGTGLPNRGTTGAGSVR